MPTIEICLMKNKFLLSIVIPCFNSSKTIIRALDSVASSSNANIQIICVDDGSTDNTVELIQNYSSSIPIKILSNSRSKGVAGALNTGILESNSTYICRLDSDDAYEPGYIDNCIYFMECNPDVTIAATSLNKIFLSQNNKILSSASQIYPNDHSFLLNSLSFMVIFGANVIFRKSTILFNESLWGEEELDFAINNATCGKLGFVSNSSYSYFLTPSTGRSYKNRFKKKIVMVYLNFKAIYRFNLSFFCYFRSVSWLFYGLFPETFKRFLRPFLYKLLRN